MQEKHILSNVLEPAYDIEADGFQNRIIEDEIESAIDSRNESLQALRELGPPDLVHLVKQSVKSGGRQVDIDLLPCSCSEFIMLTHV